MKWTKTGGEDGRKTEDSVTLRKKYAPNKNDIAILLLLPKVRAS